MTHHLIGYGDFSFGFVTPCFQRDFLISALFKLKDLKIMWPIKFILLGAVNFATSVPLKQDHVVVRSFTSIIQNVAHWGDSTVAAGESSVVAVAASLKRAWADPSIGGFNPNGPTSNAAIWQEAIRLDAAAAAAGSTSAISNKEAYLQIQYFQSQENSSNNGVTDGPANFAKALQWGQIYPAMFFQAQVDDSTKSMSKLCCLM